ncbi:hypothetical protein EIP91_005789 [Steccherinum ochraceum]|uniref:Uncharacterized protein n=1 Tax=Steccherinum ochraceum TaxID=92696 RepID=A0A4R0RHP6_9APHY|nr:hypothetical protein EIP91_005789 [Steccherinum ochraceum]
MSAFGCLAGKNSAERKQRLDTLWAVAADFASRAPTLSRSWIHDSVTGVGYCHTGRQLDVHPRLTVRSILPGRLRRVFIRTPQEPLSRAILFAQFVIWTPQPDSEFFDATLYRHLWPFFLTVYFLPYGAHNLSSRLSGTSSPGLAPLWRTTFSCRSSVRAWMNLGRKTRVNIVDVRPSEPDEI